MTTTEGERLAYRPKEVARLLSCSDDMVSRLMASGELKSFKIGAGRFVSAETLRSFVSQRDDAAAGEAEVGESRDLSNSHTDLVSKVFA